MDNKLKKELSSYLDKQDLKYTKKDRERTMQTIRNQTTTNQNNKRSYTRPILPIIASFAVLVLAIALLPSLIGNEKPNAEQDSIIAPPEKEKGFAVLLMGEDVTSKRNPFNLLLTFNTDQKSVKVVSLPRDLYVDRYNAESEKFEKTKLLHVGAHDSDPVASMNTVSYYLDIPIDYYALMPLEEILQLLEIDSQSDIKDIAEQNSLANLLNEEQVFPELMELISHHQTNMTKDVFNKMNKESRQYEMIEIEEELNSIFVDEIYYVELESSSLERLKNDLQHHIGR
ncbi:LCP family glycopolymer transferase [Gracilibacillus sp. HCP3S3_G5_1]|uniref:LCP family glycopolymer transferase n=1 Tax=unclassified Gracilibacillus TaxID=2625209 RepID=UPI003F8A4F9C